MSETYDYMLKFLIIGSAGSGKSCLLKQFIDKKFRAEVPHTIGVEFGSKVVNIAGKSVKLQIWDTAGQERFKAVTQTYYRDAVGALLVFDITNRSSFNALQNWLRDARSRANPNIVVLLIGNKKDLESERDVTFLEAKQFAFDNKLTYMETSAKSGEKVEEAFLCCTKEILNKIQTGEIDPERSASGIQPGHLNFRTNARQSQSCAVCQTV